MSRVTVLFLVALITAGCQTRKPEVEIQKFPDGSIYARRSGYKDGTGQFVYNGKQTFLAQNGRVILEGLYSHGLREGEWRYWNGERYFRGVYKDGKPWNGIFPEPIASTAPPTGIRYQDGEPVTGKPTKIQQDVADPQTARREAKFQ